MFRRVHCDKSGWFRCDARLSSTSEWKLKCTLLGIFSNISLKDSDKEDFLGKLTVTISSAESHKSNKDFIKCKATRLLRKLSLC